MGIGIIKGVCERIFFWGLDVEPARFVIFCIVARNRNCMGAQLSNLIVRETLRAAVRANWFSQ
jgi:hypothetical protein